MAGRVGGRLIPDTEEYDPASNAWRVRASIPTPRGGLGSGTLSDRIQVFGGEGPSGLPTNTYPQNEEYDPASDTWRSLARMPTPRHGLYGATVGNVLFAPSGGPIQGLNFSNAHEAFYLPPEQPPTFEASGVVNAASAAAGVGPGTLVSLFGRRLGPATQAVFRFPLPAQMHSVSVKADGAPLPLLYVGPEQINFHLPHELAGAAVNLTVTQGGVESAAVRLTFTGSSWPGIFTLGQSGQGQGAILIAGTAVVAGEVPGVPSRAARKGQVVEIYCTGLGGVSGAPAAGQPAPTSPLARTLETASVTIGGAAAEVLFSGLAPGLAGVYQVNAVVPAAAASGPRASLVMRMGAGPASNTATMAVVD